MNKYIITLVSIISIHSNKQLNSYNIYVDNIFRDIIESKQSIDIKYLFT